MLKGGRRIFKYYFISYVILNMCNEGNVMDNVNTRLILLSISPKVYIFKLARNLSFSSYWGEGELP